MPEKASPFDPIITALNDVAIPLIKSGAGVPPFIIHYTLFIVH